MELTYIADTFYLPLDCPSCGRARLLVNVNARRVECEKCHATDWNCNPSEHEQGGPHPQWTNEYNIAPRPEWG